MSDDGNNEEKPTFAGAITVLAGMLIVGFTLSYLSEHYHDAVMSGFAIIVGLGILYALIKHTASSVATIIFLVVFGVIGGVVNSCTGSSNPDLHDGPGRYHP